MLNTVGPFATHGPEVVEACLAAGVHYLDTTGEQDWLITCDEKYGADFEAAGLLLSPGVAQMYTTGEIAAQLCLETPGPRHPRHRGVLGRQPDHRLDPDDPGQRRAVEGLLPRAERLPGVGPRGRALPARHPRPARAGAGAAVGRHVAPGLVQARPAGRQLQGARRGVQQAADARRAADRGGRHRGHQGHGPRRPLRRPHRDGRPGDEPDAAAREPAHQQVAGLRARIRARSAARTASSTATATTSRPGCSRRTPPTRCSSRSRGGPASPAAARPSATASCSARCAASGWSMEPVS